MADPRHLARRFFESLSPAPPSPADDAWAEGHLGAGEQALWRRMRGFDRRHAIGVARRTLDAVPDAAAPVVAAALLHDVGKIDSDLGVFARVGATLWRSVRGAEAAARGRGRVARYVDHAAIGARLLGDAGADPVTVAWAAEHHRPEREWTVSMEIGRALKAADDD